MPDKKTKLKNTLDKMYQERALSTLDVIAEGYKKYGFSRQAKLVKNLKQDVKNKFSQL